MSEFLHLQGVEKNFDENPVLRGLDLHVDQGECLVLLGPSGCGKTTLLNVIAGLLPPDAGRVSLDGTVLDDPAAGQHLPPRKRRFGMVFQDFSLWPSMSVAGNIDFGLRVQGVPAAERRRRVGQVLDQVRMSDRADQQPSELSGGQQQRIAIARALAIRPRILLFDEPLSALDARLREDLRAELAGLLVEHGITAVYVTHDQLEAYALADRIALMHDGAIAQLDRPETLYSQPRSRFVAEFLGAGNLFDCSCDSGTIRVNGSIEVPAGDSGHPDRRCAVIPRNAVRVFNGNSTAGQAGPEQVELNAVCRHNAFLGERHEVCAETPDGMAIRGFADHRIEPGSPVRVRFHRQAVRCVED